MKMEDIKSFLYNKNSMLVLSYLTKNIYEENTITSISKELEISVGSVHSILKKFEECGLVKTRTLGKNIIYNLMHDSSKCYFRLFTIKVILVVIK